MLHIVSKSSLFERCLRYCNPGDEIILIGSGVETLPADCSSLSFPLSIYGLKGNIEKSALPSHIPDYINLVNYEQFVKLAVKHLQSMTWF
jgi:sulfur relay protein TusB/DsrH